MDSAEHPPSHATDLVERVPLDERERAYLRTRDTGETKVGLVINLALAVLIAVSLAFSPSTHSFWPLFGFGILLLIWIAFSLSVYFGAKNVRTDLAVGVKHRRDGTVESVSSQEGADRDDRPTYYIDVSFEGDDGPRSLLFTVSKRCYDAVESGDRVRVAYAPRSNWLLDLTDGDYSYVASRSMR